MYWNHFPLLTITLFGTLNIVRSTYDGGDFEGSLEYSVNNAPCVRLFANQGDMGCRTSSSESVGALYEVGSSNDISSLEGVDVDFAVVVSDRLLSVELLEKVHSLSRGKGIIVYEEDAWSPTKSDEAYSPDMTCPQGLGTYQENFTIGNDIAWNNYGNGNMYSSFKIPIVRVSFKDDVQKLMNMCAENRKYGLKSNRVNVAEFRYYMGKDGVTSKTCLEWTDAYGNKSPQCLPIGGASIWASGGTLDNRDKVILTTGIDSTAFFHDLAFGANDAAASIAAALSAADIIGRSNPSSLPFQPLFFLANAEEWGYAGSRRFVRDITSGIACSSPVDASETITGLPLCTNPVYPSTLFSNLSSESIKDVLAIDQIGKINDGKVYVHSLDADSSTTETILSINFGLDDYSASSSSQAGQLPPSPLTSFLTEINTLSGKGVVLSGYDSKFDDPAYHSHFDQGNVTVNKDDVIAAAVMIAKSVYALCGGDSTDTAAVNATWTAELLQCLLTDWNCPSMQNFIQSEKRNIEYLLHGQVSFDMGTVPPNYYVGTLNGVDGALPVVQHGHYIYGIYDEAWDKETDRAYIIPNALEAFLRSALSYTLAFEDNVWPQQECSSPSDCGNCTILSFEAVKMDCVLSKCICPNSFYHLAVDPGIKSDVYPHQFLVVDESTPSYTEPYWRNIGLRVYPRASVGISVTTLVVGLAASFVSCLTAWKIREHFRKLKVL